MKQDFPRPCCPAGDAAVWARPLAFAERACRCPARLVVAAMMPPVPWRLYPIDLLLLRFLGDDESPVVRGRRTLWLRWHWLESDCG